ncbi:hypothetical protein P4U43_17665, partial [Arthrobacter sp. EH-1B-1]
PAFILSQDQTLRKKLRTQHKPPGKREAHAAQNSKPAKKPATPPGRDDQQINQSKNNRYQQTWHTIEFSNNRSNSHTL